MKLLHIVGEIDGGGVGAVVYNYIKYMDVDDISFDVLAFEVENGKIQLLDEPFQELGVKIHYFKHRNNGYYKHFKAFRKLLYDNKYDVVHCHFGIWSTPYLLIAKMMGISVRIAHSHIARDEYRGIKQVCLNLSKPFLYGVTTHRFACGIEAGRNLWGNRAFYVLNNAVNVEMFSYNETIRNKKRKELCIKSNEILIGHVGRFCYQKNQEFLIKIAKSLKCRGDKYKLVLVGSGENEVYIKEVIQKEGLGDMVLLLGLRDDIHELLQAMDLFLLPSRYEGLPVVAIEAQTAGVDVIVSDKVTREVGILNNTMFLSIDSSVEKWVDTIEKNCLKEYLLRHEAASIMKENGYDIKIESKKLREYYLNIIK